MKPKISFNDNIGYQTKASKMNGRPIKPALSFNLHQIAINHIVNQTLRL
jgi:hypothetical protein